MIKKFFLVLFFVGAGIFIAVAAYAQVCPHIYEGINCGANWYCNGCQTSCKNCPSGGDPVGATELNYVSCSCGCPSGKIVCNLPPNTCITPPACFTPTRENAATCNGCGACKAGYAPDPTAPDAPNPCLKAAYVDYANTGTYFQISGDLKSASGDLYLANGKAIRVDGAGTTTLNVKNFTGTSLDLTLAGGLVVKGAMALTSQGAGTINAEKLCINNICRDTWPTAVSAFVQNGNTFGTLAVLGTNDSYDLAIRTAGAEKMRITTGGNVGIGIVSPGTALDVLGNIRSSRTAATASDLTLSAQNGIGYVGSMANNVPIGFITNNTERVRIDTAGNVGIGTASPSYKLVVRDNTNPAHIYVWDGGGNNPELDLGNGTNHWAIYRDVATDQLRFWRASDLVNITNGGNVGIGTASPAYKLDVAGQINATTNLTPAIQGISSASDGQGVYGAATNAAGANYGGYFESAGDAGVGVYGLSSNAAGSGAGGVFQSDGTGGVGAYGMTSGQGGTGLYGYANGESSTAVYGGALSLTGSNKGGSFFAGNPTVVTSGENNIGVMGAGGGSSGKNYGGYFKAQGAGYGVYSVVTDANAWSGYFTGGLGLYTNAEVVGAATGGYKGSGTLNAEQLCIQGNCLGSWPSGTTPSGGDGQIQFNDAGVFGGDAGLTYVKNTDVLTVGGNLKVGMAAAGNDDYIYFDDGSKYIRWTDAQAMFSFSNGVFSDDFLSGTQITARSGGYSQAVDVSNTKSINIRHMGTYGLLSTEAASPGVDAGNLVLQSDTEYPANYVQISDELRVNSTLTVVGNATVLGRNVCLQDGTNCPVGGGTIGGSGTTNYLAKFTAGTTIGNSLIYDNATNVGIGTTAPTYKLDVSGDAKVSGSIGAGTNPNSGYGITAQGSTMGGYFRDSDNSGYAYAGFWDDGVFAYGNFAGIEAYGGSYGVYASGTSYAGYFSGNVLATGNLTAGSGTYVVYRCTSAAPANKGVLVVDYGGSEPKILCGSGNFVDTGLRVK